MAKLTLTVLTGQYASVAAHNANNDSIETALENTLSRDGTAPNAMEADLNMDGFRILNLPDPTTPSEPATYGQLQAASVETDIPSQTGNSGKHLTTDGSVLSWDALSAADVSGIAGVYAPLASPALTGTPTVPTATPGDNTTKAASTEFVTAAVTAATAQFSTGDVKLTLKTTADSGWVLMNDTTIGSATSGATGRANADTSSLYALLWANTADAQCAVSTGRGANAAADFAANKTLALPKALGRALATYGSGSGLTARVLALAIGHESLTAHTHTGPAHTHTATTSSDGAHTHTVQGTSGGGIDLGAGTAGSLATPTTSSNGAHTHTLTTSSDGTGATGSTGAGNAENMQPTLFLNIMIKL